MKTLFYFAVIIWLVALPAKASVNIDMAEVRKIAKLPVEDILDGVPVEIFDDENYWQRIRGRQEPLVVMFYSNNDSPSQRMASLVKYLALDYSHKLAFALFKVAEEGKPTKEQAKRLKTLYNLDSTPGILFYDNTSVGMELEEDYYIEADFKEFRTPKMMLWKTYYNVARKAMNELLID